MNVKKEIDKLLQKDMDRLTFLKHVGVGFAAITGVATVVKSMSSFGGQNVGQHLSAGSSHAQAYGMSPYGGGGLRYDV